METVVFLPLQARARAGDQKSLEEIVDAFYPFLVKFAGARLGALRRWYDASDVANPVMVKVWRALMRIEFAGARRFGAYLKTSALNKLKELEIRPKPVASLGPGQDPVFDETALQMLIEEEGAARVVAAIDQLLPAHREIIRLKCFEQLTTRQIMARLNISQACVHQRLCQARRRLAEKLGLARKPRD